MTRYAVRALRRAPLLSSVVVLSLGLGIGVNTAIFSWIEALTLRPIPGVADAGAYFGIEARADGGTYPGSSWAEYLDLRGALEAFRDVMAYRLTAVNVGEGDHTERAYALLVSGNYFPALGLRPATGRLLDMTDAARPGGAPVAVVSDAFWRARLAAAPDAVGRALVVNGVDVTIVGVAPPAFQGTVIGLQMDLWMPATLAPVLVPGTRELDDRASRGYSLMGRLADGATRAQASAELERAMSELARDWPGTNRDIGGEVRAFWQATRGPQGLFLQALALLQGVLLLLLFAVCGNIATLLLARAAGRQQEMGVRLALGAPPWRIAGLILGEHLLLGVPGTVLGVVIASWGSEALRAVPLSTAFPVRFQTGIDGIGLAVAAGLGGLAVLLSGAAPAWQLARVNPLDALRAHPRGLGGGCLRTALVGVEVALAVPVLLAAGLFVQGLQTTYDLDPGFQRDGVLLAAYDLSAQNPDPGTARRFATRLLDDLQSRADIQHAAIATSVPLDVHGMPSRAFALEGRPSDPSAPDRALRNIVTPGYFATMGIAVLEGVDFVRLDERSAPPQAIVNEAFVSRFVPDGGAVLGRRLTSGGLTSVITAVVADSRYESFSEPPTPIVYYSYRDRPAPAGEIHVRATPGADAGAAGAIRRAVRALDQALPVYNVRTLADHVETNLFLRRIPARLFAVLGPLLLVLAGIGIFAVVAHAVARQAPELGVRLALGASAGTLVRRLVLSMLRTVALGGLVGWLLVVIVLAHLAPGDPLDLRIFGGVPLLLLLVAACASWLPARRITGIDAARALREG
ncbi:MAG: ADOP family duplicated permease [Vicinamibacterales bacterium]